MESDIGEVLLRQSQRVARVGQKDIAAVFIDSHIGMFATLEIGQLGGVVALDPARFVDRNRLVATLCAVLVLQAILNNLELQRVLSRLVIAFLPRSKRLLISQLQSPSAVILEPPKIVCHCFPIYLP